MRNQWWIEVTALEDAELATELSVQATGWRDALEKVRRQRNESGPLSFEIMGEGGFRAIDPESGWRYVVAQQPIHELWASYLASNDAVLDREEGRHLAHQVVISRDHDATPELPLTYRERGVAVAIDVRPEAATALLRRLLNELCASLDKHPPGQVVELAAFPGRVDPRRLPSPLVTLSYKDWRGEVLLGFPRRAEPTERLVVEPRHPSS